MAKKPVYYSPPPPSKPINIKFVLKDVDDDSLICQCIKFFFQRLVIKGGDCEKLFEIKQFTLNILVRYFLNNLFTQNKERTIQCVYGHPGVESREVGG